MSLDTKMGHHNVLSPSDEYSGSYPYSPDLDQESYDNFVNKFTARKADALVHTLENQHKLNGLLDWPVRKCHV